MKTALKYLLFPIVFKLGYFTFLFTKKTSKNAYAAFRFLFVKSNGKLNDFISFFISKSNPIKEEALSGSIFSNDLQKVNTLVQQIQENGFAELDIQLPENMMIDLIHFAESTPCKCLDLSQKGVVYLKEKNIFNEQNPSSPRYQIDEKDIVQHHAVREIIFDPFFRVTASNYLKCNPILDIVTMWWSVPLNNQGTAQAAQMYHFDMDRLKFLKFFFYLTDVDSENGPHCYIKKSHRYIPKALRKDGRIEDNELEKVYSQENILEFTGKKGTILAIDTRGFHKGKSLTKDKRLLFQIQFSNSLFGAPYEQMKIEGTSVKEKQIISANKRTYQLFN